MNLKVKRASSDILRELNDILLKESNDDLFKKVTLTYVEVSNDLGYAKIYFTTMSEDEDIITNELNKASSFFRTLLAKRLDIRHIPELKFIYDESIGEGEKIENIISNLHKEE